MKIAIEASEEKKAKVVIEKSQLDKTLGRMTIAEVDDYIDKSINDFAALKQLVKWLFISFLLFRLRK